MAKLKEQIKRKHRKLGAIRHQKKETEMETIFEIDSDDDERNCSLHFIRQRKKTK